MPISEPEVLKALESVIDPDLNRDIVSLGFVKRVSVDCGVVSVTVELTTPACPVKDLLRDQCADAIRALPGVESVEVEMTAAVRPREIPKEDALPHVRHCIAIASGKGGVGKSTVTVNLAAALAQSGAAVGVLDADVYGPSIPMMLGCRQYPYTQDGKIVPIETHGLKVMSLGLLLEEGQTVMWRGPMVATTVRQLLQDVDWGELDYLLIDLPPGTGDAPMSVAQLAPLTGVVLVATPQHVAANIAAKSIALFEKLEAPILGVVENMAEFLCPSCGTATRIFSGLGGEELARRFSVPFLGSVPLDPAISESSDEGEPSFLAHSERPQADAFRVIAGNMAAQISIATLSKQPTPTAG